jgi:hypothetical protein
MASGKAGAAGGSERRHDRSNLIDALEPERRSEYARQHLRPKVKPATQAVAPEPMRPSPLPSVREIDAALQVKYGATRYEHR